MGAAGGRTTPRREKTAAGSRDGEEDEALLLLLEEEEWRTERALPRGAGREVSGREAPRCLKGFTFLK